MRVFSFYCCCGDFNYKELTLFCIGESVTSIVFLQLGDKYTYYCLDRKCYFLEGGDMYNKVADFYNKFK